MQVMMTGEPTFDPAFYDKLTTCLEKLDPRLLQSVGAQWDGMVSYANSGGSGSDPWPRCEAKKWFEYNCTTQDYGQMPIFEPCNYASNVAYYHTVTEICARQEWNIPQEHGTIFTCIAKMQVIELL
jgi:hypothetical protein